ncbi:PilZ domain-containing protein [Sphingomonas sp. Leaf38]|nr:PilZ domain-containing protein [Sphingomonas sp. Leaf38]KQN31473.1 hypothetical protein ASF00_01310 [Sphingomonas sp. Leaf34]
MDRAVPLSRATRTSVMLKADLFRLDRTDADSHRVTNISETGLCIVQPDGLAVGSVVVVAIGQVQSAAADVVWVRGGLAGLKFHKAIDVARARLRRGAGDTVTPPAAGWLAALNDPYAR